MKIDRTEQFTTAIKKLLELHDQPISQIESSIEKLFFDTFVKDIDLNSFIIKKENTRLSNFMYDLISIIKSSKLKPQVMFHIIENCIGNHRHATLSFLYIKKRNFPRRFKRPECQKFHELYGQFPTNILDYKFSTNRNNPDRPKPTLANIRNLPRKIERLECERFHDIYGQIPAIMLDNKGPSYRK